MERSNLLEEEDGSYQHLLSYDHRHYILHCACCSAQLEQLNCGYQLAVYVEQYRNSSLYVLFICAPFCKFLSLIIEPFHSPRGLLLCFFPPTFRQVRADWCRPWRRQGNSLARYSSVCLYVVQRKELVISWWRLVHSKDPSPWECLHAWFNRIHSAAGHYLHQSRYWQVIEHGPVMTQAIVIQIGQASLEVSCTPCPAGESSIP